MNYSVLIYDSPEGFAQVRGPEAGKLMSQWPPFIKAMTEAGVFVTGAGLQSPETATTLRFNGDKRLVQDGPYADTKEQLGGFYIVNAPDLDTVLDWAARTPRLPGQVIEVRPNLPSAA